MTEANKNFLALLPPMIVLLQTYFFSQSLCRDVTINLNHSRNDSISIFQLPAYICKCAVYIVSEDETCHNKRYLRKCFAGSYTSCFWKISHTKNNNAERNKHNSWRSHCLVGSLQVCCLLLIVLGLYGYGSSSVRDSSKLQIKRTVTAIIMDLGRFWSIDKSLSSILGNINIYLNSPSILCNDKASDFY